MRIKMQSIIGFLVLALRLLTSVQVTAQTPDDDWGTNACGQRLLYVGTPNNEFHTRIAEKGIRHMMAVYDHDHMQNLDNLEKWIAASIRDSLAEGYAMLNLENDFYDYIWDPSHPKFKESVKLTTDLLARAKKFRPNIKWGIYKCPQLLYFSDRNQIEEKMRVTSLEIMKAVDWLCPEFYEIENTPGPRTNINAYNDGTFDAYYTSKKRMEVLLKFCTDNDIKAEVSALVWPRYYVNGVVLNPVDAENWWIPGTISGILDAQHEGKKVNFVTMWDSDFWGYMYFDMTYAGYNDTGLAAQKELRDNDVSYFDPIQKQNYIVNKLKGYLQKISILMEEKCSGGSN